MALPQYKNQTGKELEIPTPSGSTMILKNGEVVEGSYYAQYVAAGILVATTGETAVYTYPEQTTINNVSAAPALNGAGTAHELRLDLTTAAAPVAYYLESVNPAGTVTAENVTVSSSAGNLARKNITAGTIYFTPVGGLQGGPDVAGTVTKTGSTTFSGTGTNTIGGDGTAAFTGTYTAGHKGRTVVVTITKAGTGTGPDAAEFDWQEQGGTLVQAVAITGSAQALSTGTTGMSITFSKTTNPTFGYKLGDTWTYHTPYTVVVTPETGAFVSTHIADGTTHKATYAHTADNAWYTGTLTFKRS